MFLNHFYRRTYFARERTAITFDDAEFQKCIIRLTVVELCVHEFMLFFS